MASHDELVLELPKLEKLSNAARLKHAKKRRVKQLKKWQEWIRMDRATGGSISRKQSPVKIDYEQKALLNNLVARNDIIGVEKLLQKGADPNISNADGLTLLHKCCIDNTVELAEVILEHGAELDARDVEGWTPLHAAAATGNLQMINMLIDQGASLVTINHDDKMPIDVAADSSIRYVLQQKMTEAGYTDDVLEYIRISVPKTMLADLKDSIKSGRDLNLQDKYGASALHVAAANGYMEVLEFLLSHEGICKDVQDNEGWTPFHAAVCWGQTETMKFLAEKGANMDVRNLHGETAYAVAEEPEVRQLILELKGEFGESQAVALDQPVEEPPPIRRPRRMSVKRTKTMEKDELGKQSVHQEAMLRKKSMAEADMHKSGSREEDEATLKELATTSGEIAFEQSEEVTLISAITLRPSEESYSETRKSPSPDEGDSTEAQKRGAQRAIEAFEIDDAVNNLSKRPRKSVLKRGRNNSTTYTTSSPPVSPTGSPPPRATQQTSNTGCCVVM